MVTITKKCELLRKVTVFSNMMGYQGAVSTSNEIFYQHANSSTALYINGPRKYDPDIQKQAANDELGLQKPKKSVKPLPSSPNWQRLCGQGLTWAAVRRPGGGHASTWPQYNPECWRRCGGRVKGKVREQTGEQNTRGVLRQLADFRPRERERPN